MTPIQLLQFIQEVARQANVPYKAHAEVDNAVAQLKEILSPKKDKSTEATSA